MGPKNAEVLRNDGHGSGGANIYKSIYTHTYEYICVHRSLRLPSRGVLRTAGQIKASCDASSSSVIASRSSAKGDKGARAERDKGSQAGPGAPGMKLNGECGRRQKRRESGGRRRGLSGFIIQWCELDAGPPRSPRSEERYLCAIRRRESTRSTSRGTHGYGAGT